MKVKCEIKCWKPGVEFDPLSAKSIHASELNVEPASLLTFESYWNLVRIRYNDIDLVVSADELHRAVDSCIQTYPEPETGTYRTKR